MAAMEQHLIGFSRARTEAVGTFEREKDIPAVWRRDETIQPFELHPLPVTSRGPTPEEVVQMEAAHQATIASCERSLGRALTVDERACVHVEFRNGQITGSIAFPLSEILIERQP
jgi:hypothetical protein